jgi:sugar-specific transcriptional regulator TrmB
LSARNSVEAFIALGLTRVEAEVYVYLIENSPATGYAIANAIDRTKGATYKVLGSLERRGAVLIEDAEKRLCKAVPPGEFLMQLDRDFQREKQKAIAATKTLGTAPSDDGIYRLTTYDQIYERCRVMLRECKVVAYLDIFPGPLEELREEIRAAAARGVKTAMILYRKARIPGVWTIVEPQAETALRKEPFHYVSISVDGRQFLMAIISRDDGRVLDAFWSANLLYSFSMGSYLKYAILAVIYESLIEKNSSAAKLKEVRGKWYKALPNFISPGFSSLAENARAMNLRKK